MYHLDISEKTISEEYTPLHLAARFNPSCYDHSPDDQGSGSSKEAQPKAASGAEEDHDGQETNASATRQFRRLASIEQVLKFLMNHDHQEVDVRL
jgi:hypothetical protein